MASPRLTLRYPEEYDHIFLRVLLFSSITNCFISTKGKKREEEGLWEKKWHREAFIDRVRGNFPLKAS